MEQNYEDLKVWQDGARRMLENDIEQMKEKLELLNICLIFL